MAISRRAFIVAASVLLPLGPRVQAAPADDIVRLTSVKSGSVAWIIQTIRDEGLEKKYGFTLKVVEVATNGAAPVALLANEADVIVSDWTWAMRQRSKGLDLKFSSYSSALGSVMVPGGSTIDALSGLVGKKIGVAGTGVDKSWILLRAYGLKSLGKDFAKVSDVVFGAAPLIAEEFRSGRLDACLNFWTYAAKLEADGGRELVSMADVIKALGIAHAPPLVGFIWSERGIEKSGAPVGRLLQAVEDANKILAASDAAWDRLKPLIRAASDKELAAIKAHFRAGITAPWNSEATQAAEKLTQLLIDLGDTELVGNGTRFDPNLFYTQAG